MPSFLQCPSFLGGSVDDDEENDTFSMCVTLDDVTVFEAGQLDAIALLADTGTMTLIPR